MQFLKNIASIAAAIPDIIHQLREITFHLSNLSQCVRSGDSNHKNRPSITTGHWNDR